MSNRQKGFALAFFSAVLYGTVPILGKKFVNVFHPLFVAFALTLVTGCYFTITALWKKDLFRNFVFKKIKWIALIGFFATLGSIFSFFGLSFGRANEAGFFFQFETFFAGILAFLFLKERLSASQVKGLAVMFIGAYLFLTPFSFSLRIGNLFFLGSALVWGINDVIIKKNVKNISPLFLAFGRNFFSVIFLFPLAYRYIPQNLEKITFAHLLSFLLYGAIVAGIVLSLYLALRYIKTAEATAFQLLVPIVATVISFFVLGEGLNSLELVGGVLILAGLFLMMQKLKKEGKIGKT